jgi:hypothetical protein
VNVDARAIPEEVHRGAKFVRWRRGGATIGRLHGTEELKGQQARAARVAEQRHREPQSRGNVFQGDGRGSHGPVILDDGDQPTQAAAKGELALDHGAPREVPRRHLHHRGLEARGWTRGFRVLERPEDFLNVVEKKELRSGDGLRVREQPLAVPLRQSTEQAPLFGMSQYFPVELDELYEESRSKSGNQHSSRSMGTARVFSGQASHERA